jgi:hypothetical protein
MKKLLTLFLLGITAVTSAAIVYDVDTIPYINANGEGTAGSYYTIRLKEAGSLWITDFFNNTGSGTQSELLTSPTYGLTEYGYKDSTGVHNFSFSDTSRISQGDSYKYNLYKEAQGKEADVMYRNKYFLGDFKGGEEIEIWLSNGTNSVASNTPAGYHLSTFNKRTDALNAYMDVGQLYLPGSSQINFGIIATSMDVVPDDGAGQMMGSPLPSKGLTAIIALFTGLTIFGFYKGRNKPCDEEWLY